MDWAFHMYYRADESHEDITNEGEIGGAVCTMDGLGNGAARIGTVTAGGGGGTAGGGVGLRSATTSSWRSSISLNDAALRAAYMRAQRYV